MVRPGTLAAKGSSTAWIWRASSRVGDTTTAPTCAPHAAPLARLPCMGGSGGAMERLLSLLQGSADWSQALP